MTQRHSSKEFYHLYVVDDRGRSVIVRDSHNVQGNRTWTINVGNPFTIVLEHNGFATFMIIDENGDMIIEQGEVRVERTPPPEAKRPKRRSRFNWQRSR